MTSKFRRKFREWRENAGISQTELADISGVPQSNISKVERGDEGKRFQWEHMVAIHNATGIDLNYLADDTRVDRPTREFVAKLAEVQRAVKLLGVDEVLRRIVDQPRQEYYPAYNPQPMPSPYPSYPPGMHRQPVDPRHFGGRVEGPYIQPNADTSGAWMDEPASGPDTEPPTPPRRRRKA